MSSSIMALQQHGTQQIGYWMTYPTGTSTCREDDLCKEARLDGGEISASGDDAPAKIRKPYTITKQRERWTEDEHQKFLEALKLYGRAWRRIEEHIGSKTAVQIRSHAQKFFSKLERKASIGSLTATGGSQDIEIPPPRPKRKPSHPYPRKAGGAFSISSSFEEDNKSPRAVCSAFTPLGSPTELNLWKSMRQTTFPTPSSPLSLETVNLQEVSHEVQQRVGTSASLRLFGQTVLVPGSEISVLDTDHQIDPSDSTGLESESTESPRSEVSNEFDENSGIQQETNVCSWQPQEAVGACSDNESSEALVFDSDELLQTCENNMELSKGAQEASQKEQKLNLDLSSHTDRSNDSAISNLASSNSIPCKGPLLPSPHRLSALQHASKVCEGVSPLTLPNIGGSCFTPWHPSHEVAKQHSAVFPTPARAFWHSLPPEHFFQRSNDDASAAAAVAAASFAVASAWQVIQGAIPTAIRHPNMGMVYSPVAILAAPTESAFGPATMFSGSFSPLEQPTNTNLTCKQARGKLEVNHKHNDGNEIENKLAEMQANSAVVSTEEGHNGPFELCIISCESSCENIDGAPSKKRCRISYGTGTESCKSRSRTHSRTCDTRLSDSERSENVDIIPFPETDTEVVQHASTDSASRHNSNSLNNEAISVNSIKNEECDDKKQEIGSSQLLSGQMKQNPPQGLHLPEVCDIQNVPIDKDENGKKQKKMLDEETQACIGVYTSNIRTKSILLAEDRGGIQLKDEQQCGAFVEKSVSLPPGSKLNTQADQKLEIASSEESEKNRLFTGQLKNGNSIRVQTGSYGGLGETGMSVGKHQFVTIGRLASASSYSGVGFVPYKRASGEVKVPRSMVS